MGLDCLKSNMNNMHKLMLWKENEMSQPWLLPSNQTGKHQTDTSPPTNHQFSNQSPVLQLITSSLTNHQSSN